MSTVLHRAPLKSIPTTPTGLRAAEPAPTTSGGGAPKDVARQGVNSVLRPEMHPTDGRYPVAWLHITAPKGAIPTATSKCACGWDRSAVGRHNVLALIEAHTAHRENCPLRTTEERDAA